MEANLQNRITGYWTRRAGAFSAQRRRELAGEKHDQWLAALHRYLPAQGGLRILDLGTGSGFFAMLLAAEGNTVTGIDLTPAMIEKPRPDWDRELLQQAGFSHIRVDTGIWREIYTKQDEFYNPTPIFAISARA